MRLNVGIVIIENLRKMTIDFIVIFFNNWDLIFRCIFGVIKE